MAVNESPLETRESLVALLSNRYFSNNSLGNIGKQFDDAMKFLEEVRVVLSVCRTPYTVYHTYYHLYQVRLRLPDKSWREYARNAWDISPSLAVFLPQRLNCSTMLEAEVSRLVRLRPEDVCHIPRALDFFLTKEALESDAPELPHVLTWARCSPIRALSLLCQRTLPTHPLTAQGRFNQWHFERLLMLKKNFKQNRRPRLSLSLLSQANLFGVSD